MPEKPTPKIKNVEFVRGVTGTNSILDDTRPHIAFIGRSNVGKSSMLNTLLGRSVARVSKTAGKTQEINFFLVNDNVYFVDLPGYGYAKVSAQFAEKLRKRIIWYFSESGARPLCTVLILDAKVGLTDLDKDMLDILGREGHSVLVVLNKIDKLNQKELHAKEKEVVEVLEAQVVLWQLALFSAQTGKGKDSILSFLLSSI